MKGNSRIAMGHLAHFLVVGFMLVTMVACSGGESEKVDGKIHSAAVVSVPRDSVASERSELEAYLERLEQVQLSEDSVLTAPLGAALVYTDEVWRSTGTLFSIEYDETAFDKKVLQSFSGSEPNMEGSDSGSESCYLISKKVGEYVVRVNHQRNGNDAGTTTYRVTVK